MITILFDVKCGYENIFICEKNIEFPLSDVLLESKTYTKILNKKFLKNSDLELSIFNYYVSCPEKLISDFCLFQLIYNSISVDYLNKGLNNFQPEDGLFHFCPEFFKIENCRLKFIKDANVVDNDSSSEDNETVDKDDLKIDA